MRTSTLQNARSSGQSRSSSLLDDDVPQSESGTDARSKLGERANLSKFTAIGAAIVSCVLLTYVAWSTYKSWSTSPLAQSKLATLKDVETGEVFENFSTPSEKSFPYQNPKTGKLNLFPAEACYWTKDGKAKFPPSFVILNERLGKSGPTICPDCGKQVRRFNPLPPDALMQQAWDAAASEKKR